MFQFGFCLKCILINLIQLFISLMFNASAIYSFAKTLLIYLMGMPEVKEFTYISFFKWADL